MERPRRLPWRYAWKMLGAAMALVLLVLVGLDIFLEKPPASQYFVFNPRSFFSSTST